MTTTTKKNRTPSTNDNNKNNKIPFVHKQVEKQQNFKNRINFCPIIKTKNDVCM